MRVPRVAARGPLPEGSFLACDPPGGPGGRVEFVCGRIARGGFGSGHKPGRLTTADLLPPALEVAKDGFVLAHTTSIGKSTSAG